jgi:hypothetical protein
MIFILKLHIQCMSATCSYSTTTAAVCRVQVHAEGRVLLSSTGRIQVKTVDAYWDAFCRHFFLIFIFIKFDWFY